MSRNISTFEKALIIVLVMAAVFGLGAYFIVLPVFDSIEAVDAQIEKKNEEIETAEALKNRLIFLMGQYTQKRERAGNVHEGFYGELTATEAVTIVQELLEGANNGRGFSVVDGIRVSEIESAALSLQLIRGDRNIAYELRELAQLFWFDEEGDEIPRPVDEDEEEWLIYDELAKIELGANASEEELIALQLERFNEFLKEPAIFLREVAERLKARGGIPVSERADFLNWMRMMLAPEFEEVGRISATFMLNLDYEEYLGFLDYLEGIPSRAADPKLVSINRCILFEDAAAANEYHRDLSDNPFGASDAGLYLFELHLYIVLPMDMPPPRRPAIETSADAETTPAQEE